MNEYLGAAETDMRLALRSQSQSRATIETLATIKNPPTVYAKQVNLANGPPSAFAPEARGSSQPGHARVKARPPHP